MFERRCYVAYQRREVGIHLDAKLALLPTGYEFADKMQAILYKSRTVNYSMRITVRRLYPAPWLCQQ